MLVFVAYNAVIMMVESISGLNDFISKQLQDQKQHRNSPYLMF